jgi:hypothetical protein
MQYGGGMPGARGSFVLFLAAAIVFAPAEPPSGSHDRRSDVDVTARVLATTLDVGESQGGGRVARERGLDHRRAAADRVVQLDGWVLACLVGAGVLVALRDAPAGFGRGLFDLRYSSATPTRAPPGFQRT